MADHIDLDEIEQFVLGTLPAERRKAFAEHMASCTACAHALADEARFEFALTEAVGRVKDELPEQRFNPPRHRWRLALAAACALVLLSSTGRRAYKWAAAQARRADAAEQQVAHLIEEQTRLAQRVEILEVAAAKNADFADAWLDRSESEETPTKARRQARRADLLLASAAPVFPARRPPHLIPTGYVYVGVCGSSGWKKEETYFDGLPDCVAGEPVVPALGTTITATDGRFVRADPKPSAAMVSRLKPNERARLINLHNITLSPVLGAGRMYWGEIELPGHSD